MTLSASEALEHWARYAIDGKLHQAIQRVTRTSKGPAAWDSDALIAIRIDRFFRENGRYRGIVIWAVGKGEPVADFRWLEAHASRSRAICAQGWDRYENLPDTEIPFAVFDDALMDFRDWYKKNQVDPADFKTYWLDSGNDPVPNEVFQEAVKIADSRQVSIDEAMGMAEKVVRNREYQRRHRRKKKKGAAA